MSRTNRTKGLLISKQFNPFYQADIEAVQSILTSFDLSMDEGIVMDTMYAVGMLPLDKDPLKQQRLLEMVSVFSARGYNDIASRLLSVIREDNSLCIEIEGLES